MRDEGRSRSSRQGLLGVTVCCTQAPGVPASFVDERRSLARTRVRGVGDRQDQAVRENGALLHLRTRPAPRSKMPYLAMTPTHRLRTTMRMRGDVALPSVPKSQLVPPGVQGTSAKGRGTPTISGEFSHPFRNLRHHDGPSNPMNWGF